MEKNHNKIDKELVYKLINTYRVKSGLDEFDFKSIAVDEVDDGGGIRGEADRDSKGLLFLVIYNADDPIRYLKIFIHELLHLSSWKLDSGREVTGVDHDSKYVALNEAITQKLTYEILLEYANLLKMPKDIIEKIKSFYEDDRYLKAMMILDRLIIKVSNYSEFDAEVVKKAFYSAYFNNANFDNLDFKEVLSLLFTKDELRTFKVVDPRNEYIEGLSNRLK